MVGALWVVLPRSAAVFDCASSPAVPMDGQHGTLGLKSILVINRMYPLSPSTQGSRSTPLCALPGQPWCWPLAVTAVHRELMSSGTSVCRICPSGHCILLILLFREVVHC